MKNRDDLSSISVVEISKKITELLDTADYSNDNMLLTKEHIKYNLAKLINSSNSQFRKIEKQRKQNNRFSVDERGKLKIDFSYNNI